MRSLPGCGFASLVALAIIVASQPTAWAEKPDDVIDIWPGDPPGEPIDAGPESSCQNL